jgi:hypothetical protein
MKTQAIRVLDDGIPPDGRLVRTRSIEYPLVLGNLWVVDEGVLWRPIERQPYTDHVAIPANTLKRVSWSRQWAEVLFTFEASSGTFRFIVRGGRRLKRALARFNLPIVHTSRA